MSGQQASNERSTIEEIRARASQNVTEIVANPREYYRVQQLLRDRADLLAHYDDLQRDLENARKESANEHDDGCALNRAPMGLGAQCDCRRANDLLKAQMDAMEDCIGVKEGQTFEERAEELIVTEVQHMHCTADEPTSIHTVGQLGEAIEPILKALSIDGGEPHQLTVTFNRNEDGSIGLINAQYIPVSMLERASEPPKALPAHITLEIKDAVNELDCAKDCHTAGAMRIHVVAALLGLGKLLHSETKSAKCALKGCDNDAPLGGVCAAHETEDGRCKCDMPVSVNGGRHCGTCFGIL